MIYFQTKSARGLSTAENRAPQLGEPLTFGVGDQYIHVVRKSLRRDGCFELIKWTINAFHVISMHAGKKVVYRSKRQPQRVELVIHN